MAFFPSGLAEVYPVPRALLLAALIALAPPAFAGLPDDPTHEGEEIAPPLTDSEAAHLALFIEPDLTPDETADVVALYDHVDPDNVIPKALKDKALVYFHANQEHIPNKRYLTVIVFGPHSKNERMHIIDMGTGKVLSLHCAHGSGSDPENDGTARLFSNTPNSKMSSLGFYTTAETYTGKHGLSLRLDGLSATNSNVRPRAVVVHGADYVEDHDVKPGRSWGCPAVSMENHVRVINALKEGSIIYADR
jgi:hypothetical protein